MKHLKKFNEGNREPDRREVPNNGVIITYEPEIFCPHCGIEQVEHPDNILMEKGGESADYDCDECGKEFYITKDIQVQYTTSR